MRYFNRPTFRRNAKMQSTLLKNRKVIISSLLTALAITFGPVANAQDDNSGAFFGKNAPGKWTIGLKAAQIDPNIEEISDADAFGVVLGYQFANPIPGFGGTASVDLEFLQSDTTQFFNGSGTSYDAEILSLFFNYRSPGTLYYKVKGGLSVTTLEVNSINPSLIADEEDTSFALGLGLGVRVSDRGLIELEYTQETGDIDLGVVSLNGLLQF